MSFLPKAGASTRSPSAADKSFQAPLKAHAQKCRTPKQFRDLLETLRAVIPYKNFYCVWGYTDRTQLCYYINIGYPPDLVRWRLTTGVLWRSPLYLLWKKTHRAFVWQDAAEAVGIETLNAYEPELVSRMTKAGAHLSICGGVVTESHFTAFVMMLPTRAQARRYLPRFEQITPTLERAVLHSFPHDLLTFREATILEQRAHGAGQKLIAANERISERTVREHLSRIKKKLGTDDLTNAVAIAVRQHMV